MSMKLVMALVAFVALVSTVGASVPEYVMSHAANEINATLMDNTPDQYISCINGTINMAYVVENVTYSVGNDEVKYQIAAFLTSVKNVVFNSAVDAGVSPTDMQTGYAPVVFILVDGTNEAMYSVDNILSTSFDIDNPEIMPQEA